MACVHFIGQLAILFERTLRGTFHISANRCRWREPTLYNGW